MSHLNNYLKSSDRVAPKWGLLWNRSLCEYVYMNLSKDIYFHFSRYIFFIFYISFSFFILCRIIRSYGRDVLTSTVTDSFLTWLYHFILFLNCLYIYFSLIDLSFYVNLNQLSWKSLAFLDKKNLKSLTLSLYGQKQLELNNH